MNGKDLFKMASSNLKRHKSRTFLTVLGIVIGTMSIIMMIALGLGMQESFDASIESMGSIDIIDVTKGDSVTSTTRLSEDETDDELSDLDMEFFATLDYVEAISPVISTNVKLASGKYEATNQLYGIDMELFDDLGYELAETSDVSDNRVGIIFGQTAAESFDEVSVSGTSSGSSSGSNFMSMMSGRGGNMDPSKMAMMGQMGESDEEEELDVDVYTERITMSLDTGYSPMNTSTSSSTVYRVQASGILEEGDMSRDRNMYMDIDVLTEMIEDNTGEEISGYDSAYLKIEDTAYVDQVVDILEAYGYEASTSADMVETIQSTTQMLQIALGAIGAIALIVAAIGITNTMIMAITERKKEIGVMKVIGATVVDIKRLFLLESAMIGFMGGVAGVGISFLITQVVTSSAFASASTGGNLRNPTSSLMSFNFSLPLWLILTGVVFTTFVGILSGYIPARKAMASSAIEALHAE